MLSEGEDACGGRRPAHMSKNPGPPRVVERRESDGRARIIGAQQLQCFLLLWIEIFGSHFGDPRPHTLVYYLLARFRGPVRLSDGAPNVAIIDSEQQSAQAPPCMDLEIPNSCRGVVRLLVDEGLGQGGLFEDPREGPRWWRRGTAQSGRSR